MKKFFYISAFSLLIIGITLFWLFTPEIITHFGYSTIETHGQFGDQFGYFNSFSSVVTVILLIIASIYQHKQYLLQKDETIKAQQAEAAMKKQEFEMVRMQHESNKLQLLSLKFNHEKDLLIYLRSVSAAQITNRQRISECESRLNEISDQITSMKV